MIDHTRVVHFSGKTVHFAGGKYADLGPGHWITLANHHKVFVPDDPSKSWVNAEDVGKGGKPPASREDIMSRFDNAADEVDKKLEHVSLSRDVAEAMDGVWNGWSNKLDERYGKSMSWAIKAAGFPGVVTSKIGEGVWKLSGYVLDAASHAAGDIGVIISGGLPYVGGAIMVTGAAGVIGGAAYLAGRALSLAAAPLVVASHAIRKMKGQASFATGDGIDYEKLPQLASEAYNELFREWGKAIKEKGLLQKKG